MRKFKIIFIAPAFAAFCLAPMAWAEPSAGRLAGYRAVLGTVAGAEGPDLALRAWEEGGTGKLLVLDPRSLRTRVAEGPEPRALTWEEARAACGPETAYFRLRGAARETRERRADAGLRSRPAASGVFLSFDLCPSTHPLDRWIFELLEKDGPALPAFVCVSGLWLEAHGEDFAWLAAERASGRLDLTWVGHGETHPDDRTLPAYRTFDLTEGLDFRAEVFGPEERLLAAGEVPGAFFRFPGLVSNPALLDRVLDWGLLPLGSGAWLAKDELPRPGDLVLVHANGNEERGLRLLERLASRRDGAAGPAWLGLADLAAPGL